MIKPDTILSKILSFEKLFSPDQISRVSPRLTRKRPDYRGKARITALKAAETVNASVMKAFDEKLAESCAPNLRRPTMQTPLDGREQWEAFLREVSAQIDEESEIFL